MDTPQNEAPNLISSSFEIEEHASRGTLVGMLEASDKELDNLTYAITDGNKHKLFRIDTKTGALTVNNSNKLDYEKLGQVVLIVSVADETNTTEGKITINLLDIPEGKVLRSINISSNIINYHMSIIENSPQGTLVGSVLENDISNKEISFSIDGGYGREAFEIDEQTGSIFIVDPLYIDYEFRRSYMLRVLIVEKYEQFDRLVTRKLNAYIRIDIEDVFELDAPDNSNLELVHTEMDEREKLNLKQSLERVNIYPNPAHSWIYLDWDSQFEGGMQIEIYDLQGRVVKSVVDYKNQTRFSTEISLDRFHSGMYILKVSVLDQTHIKWINVVQ